jgi:hypothetical protein
MPVVITPDESAIQTLLGNFLTAIVPAGVVVVAAQQNRVPEPAAPDFVLMNVIRRDRLETNVDTYIDAKFTASIAADVLMVSEVQIGALGENSPIIGPNVAAGTYVLEQTSGPTGGAGTYTLNNSQTVSSQTMSGGYSTQTQNTEITFQLDVHGPNSADNAQIISTLMRDPYAAIFFRQANPAIAPLYADDPRQMPFINDQQAFEYRYIIDCCLQANQTTSGISQPFSDSIDTTIVVVDTYPVT